MVLRTPKPVISTQDPGVVSVQRIYHVLKGTLKSDTIVMGASFRTVDEIRELAGCDQVVVDHCTSTFGPTTTSGLTR